MSKYTIRSSRAKLVIDATTLSGVLESVGRGPVDAMASEGAVVAKRQVSASESKFIGTKSTKQFRLKSGKLPKLSQMLDVPVALVVNDSWYATFQEWGTGPRPATRPLSSAFEALRGKASKSERGVSYR